MCNEHNFLPVCPVALPHRTARTPAIEPDTPFNEISTLKMWASLRPRKLPSAKKASTWDEDADGEGEETAANIHLFCSEGTCLLSV